MPSFTHRGGSARHSRIPRWPDGKALTPAENRGNHVPVFFEHTSRSLLPKVVVGRGAVLRYRARRVLAAGSPLLERVGIRNG